MDQKLTLEKMAYRLRYLEGDDERISLIQELLTLDPGFFQDVIEDSVTYFKQEIPFVLFKLLYETYGTHLGEALNAAEGLLCRGERLSQLQIDHFFLEHAGRRRVLDTFGAYFKALTPGGIEEGIAVCENCFRYYPDWIGGFLKQLFQLAKSSIRHRSVVVDLFARSSSNRGLVIEKIIAGLHNSREAGEIHRYIKTALNYDRNHFLPEVWSLFTSSSKVVRDQAVMGLTGDKSLIEYSTRYLRHQKATVRGSVVELLLKHPGIPEAQILLKNQLFQECSPEIVATISDHIEVVK